MQKKRTIRQQTFNDGVLTVYAVDRDAAGTEIHRPKHELLRYAERTVGIGRYYRAKQENAEISRLVRVSRQEDISTQDVAVMRDGLYNIRQVQYPTDVTPPCCDLSLERVTHDYEINRV